MTARIAGNCLLALCLSVLAPALCTQATAAERDLLLPPDGKSWFGAFTTQIGVETRKAFSALSSKVGKRPAIQMIFRPWTKNGSSNFPSRFVAITDRMQAIPMVTWEPWWHYSPEEYPLLSDIADGKHDEYLRAFLNDAGKFGRPWFLRFAHEMELDHYPWSEAYDERQTRQSYIDAFNHISAMARRLAPNTVMVWSPNSGSIQAMDFYPGDAGVDWVGASLYNLPDTPQDPDHPDMLSGYMAMVRHLDKPAMIAEMGCAQDYVVTSDWDADGDGDFRDKQDWIDPAMADKVVCIDRFFSVIDRKYPDIRALVWFDTDMKGDWRLDSSDSALQAFSRRIGAARYLGAPVEKSTP